MIVSAAATAFSGWRCEQLRRQHAWEMDAGVRRAAAEGAGRMAASAHMVAVLHGEGAEAVVVRLPGVRVRRGTDLVREPEVFPARDAVALTAGGECAIDVRGDLFDVSSAEASRERRPCTSSQEPSRGWNRPEVPESLTYPVEVAISDEVGCARERTGPVRCWGPILRDRGVVRRDVAVPLVDVDAVERMVPFGDRICGLRRGTVLCWGGSSRDPARGPRAGLPRAIPMGTEVTGLVSFDRDWYTRGPLCALHADGTVRCWTHDPFTTPPREVAHASLNLHSLVRGTSHLCALDERSQGWCATVSDDEDATFVRAPAFDGFTRVVDASSRHFPVRGASLRCDEATLRSPFITPDRDEPEGWVRRDCEEAARLLPRTSPVPGALLQTATPSVLTADELGGFTHAAYREVLGSGVTAIPTSAAYHRCELGVNRRVACQWVPIDEFDGPWDVDPHEVMTSDEPVRLIAGVDDAVELAVTGDGLACARRSTGSVVCWGRNDGGVLTAGVAQTPDDWSIEELLARVPSH